MDALPVTEQTDVPFKSKATAQFRGETVGVMHACGHDAHVAILLGVAEVLAGMRDQLAGQVLFVFQPAEEGPPEGERGGAILMLEQGAFKVAKPDVMYGLHVIASLPTRRDRLSLRAVHGGLRQLHDRGQGSPDARLAAVGRRRSDRRLGADRDWACRRSSAGRSTSPTCRRSSPSAPSRAASASTSFPTRCR